MEPKKENIIEAYKTAKEMGSDTTCKILETLYPDIDFTPKDNRPVTERIKTFEDACEVLGEDHLYVQMFQDIYTKSEKAGANVNNDVVAYLKLRIICAALNEGWEPQFTEDEWRYSPYYILWTEDELANKDEEWKQQYDIRPLDDYRSEYAGLAFAYSNGVPSNAISHIGSRLCFKSDWLASYAAQQFPGLWMDFYLVRK